MEPYLPPTDHVYRARLDRSGRIVLPQPVREGLRLTCGDEVLVIRQGDDYRIETPSQALQAAQEYFRSLVPASVSLVDELLAERRSEVEREREAAEDAAPPARAEPGGE